MCVRTCVYIYRDRYEPMHSHQREKERERGRERGRERNKDLFDSDDMYDNVKSPEIP